MAYWFKAQSLDKLGTAKGRKWAVFGSDSVEGKITLDLKKDGFKVKIGHKRGLLGPKTDLVIYSNAIGPDNPELREARRRGIPMMSYPEAVGTLTRRYRTFGVAGGARQEHDDCPLVFGSDKSRLGSDRHRGHEIKGVWREKFSLG